MLTHFPFKTLELCCVISFFTFSTSVFAADNSLLLAPINDYRGTVVVKRDVVKNTEYSIPLDNLKRLGRGWEPDKTKLLQGDMTSSLYQLGRGEELSDVFNHYRQQLLINANILYECSGRDCGGSNAWANDFFNDYRLYGADDNQYLLVSQNAAQSLYQVLYINRRGAGDVMVRIDRIVAENEDSNPINKVIAFQTEASNHIKVRQYIEDQKDNETFLALVSSSKKNVGNDAIKAGDELIQILKQNLGKRLTDKITFLNIATFGRDEFGEGLITLFKN